MTLFPWADNLVFRYLSVDYSPDFISHIKLQGIHLPSDFGKAVLKRRCEFLAGRACAHQALTYLGHETADSIGIGRRNEPVWPEDIVGSISHCVGHAVASVAHRSEDVAGVGVDIEKVMSREWANQLSSKIVLLNERHLVAHFDDFCQFLTLMFSAKEAIYKAIFPTVQQILDFDSVVLEKVDCDRQELTFATTPILDEYLNNGINIRVRYSMMDDTHCITWCVIGDNHLKH
ncbi:4'-phosphopantetheinyl transferase family protein [Salinivibrio proteolyticus]|uniref:Enterobactin synthase component D n=1 Tax=Salinivibrio proteolyticus TaxID=334715 RepID=A0ABY7LI45_9GAMM|nr:4'-phosphopantetheinyl transferase superfamily protein [Salinivibrio proteolyticus]WBA15595.1 4'-phosphopantetheinyl transferase superfamily protein [Salinivibrio proteolyticus]